MYLKRLQMQGFKSFPDKINIEFGAGVTAIVGPNGSGKSNIVDAIRWVLGEQSSKNLRGAKMEDVIFGGTAIRKQVGFAEVALTLDNSQNDLPLEYSEVTITRRYYRSGESEYYINQSPCRLKDIHELFMNTGLGRDGYSMIGQGKIAEVLSVRSEDRRAIFEEAAGISKYRYRKIESEKKLAATEENLLRLRDIMNELSERVGPLKSQSEKARRYLDLREERKGLEIDVWLSTTDSTKDALSKVESDTLTVGSQLASVEADVEKAEQELDQVFDKIRGKNAEVDELQRSIREEAERSASLASECAVLENDISHTDQRVEELTYHLACGDEEKQNFLEEKQKKEAEITDYQKQLVRTETEIEALTAAALAAEEKNAGLADKAEEITAQISLAAAKDTDCKIARSSLAASLSKIEEREEIICQSEKLREEKKAEAKGALAACVSKINACNERIHQNANIVIGYEKKLQGRKEKLFESQKELQKVSDLLREKSGRADLLADMEKHMEGFGYAVKKVMSEKSRGALKGILGPLSHLISTDDEYAIAVETAMGGALQHIVTETEETAKAAIRLLKEEKAGRTTFLPMTSVRGNRLSEPAAEKESGVIGVAADLVRCADSYRSIILSVCGRVLVTETIDAAVRIAKKYGYKFKIVTLDGQVVNPGGSLTGGSLQKNAGILSRKNEIDRLREECQTLDERCQKEQLAYEKLRQEVLAIEAALQGAKAESATANETLLIEEGNRSRCKLILDTLEQETNSYAEERNTILRQKEEIMAKDAALVIEAEENALQMAKWEEKLSLAAGDREQAALHAAEQKENLSGLKYAAAALQKDIDLARLSLQEIENRMTLFGREQEAKKEVLAALASERAQILQRIEEKRAATKQISEKTEQMKNRITEAAHEREEIEKSTTSLRQRVKEKTADKEKLIKEQMRLESKKAAIQTQYDQIVAKLWDEYELTVSAARQLQRPLSDKRAAEQRIAELRGAMKALGNVNLDSIEEYQTVKERFDFYTVQIADLESGRDELRKVIADLTEKMRTIFETQFEVINQKFSQVFRDLFGGGSAYLELTDPSDVLNSGIEIKVTPPGKVIKSLQLLSGGEQTFVAIALYFAILAVKPVPFCIMDEIEAALDDVNVTRFANYLRRYEDKTQFIVVTHRRGTMEEADVLYGVTMQEKGISKLLTIHVSEIEKQLKLKVK